MEIMEEHVEFHSKYVFLETFVNISELCLYSIQTRTHLPIKNSMILAMRAMRAFAHIDASKCSHSDESVCSHRMRACQKTYGLDPKSINSIFYIGFGCSYWIEVWSIWCASVRGEEAISSLETIRFYLISDDNYHFPACIWLYKLLLYKLLKRIFCQPSSSHRDM